MFRRLSKQSIELSLDRQLLQADQTIAPKTWLRWGMDSIIPLDYKG